MTTACWVGDHGTWTTDPELLEASYKITIYRAHSLKVEKVLPGVFASLAQMNVAW
jgi:hypothetical protein